MSFKKNIAFSVFTLLLITIFICPDCSHALLMTEQPLVINEIVAKADDSSDWIELYVTGDEAVYLGEYSLIDDKEGREPSFLPEIMLNPSEFIVIRATDEESEDDSYYVPFKLGADDSVTLLYGLDIVDMLDWEDGDAPSGLSYGLVPDGTGEAHTLKPTPGAPNELLDSTPTDEHFEIFPSDRVVEVRFEIDEEAWQAILANPMAEEYKKGTIIYDNRRIDNVAIRVKGNSSLMSVARDPTDNRYSFKVDLNYYEKGQDLAGLQKLSFNNGFSDPTFMREHLSYYLMRELGVPSPRTAFVNLFINDELIGLYTVVEQVDDEFVEARFGKGNGDLYQAEMGSDLQWKGESIGNYQSLELKTNEESTDHSALFDMLDELNNGSHYEAVLDVDEVLRYFAVSTALTNLDSYQGNFAQNYYLYEEDGIFSIIPWDFNMSFGGFNSGCGRDQLIDFMIDEPTMGALNGRPLIAKLLAVPDYLELYHSHLDQLITGPFSPENMYQIIDQTANLIRDYVYADPTKFFTDEEFEQGLVSGISGDTDSEFAEADGRPQFGGMGFGLTIGLEDFIYERGASISDQLNGLAPARGDGSGNCPGGFGGGMGFARGAGVFPFGDAIENVSPSYAAQGDRGVEVVISFNAQIMLPADTLPTYVRVGTLEGMDITRNDLTITALFDIPADESLGMKDVSVEFPPLEDFNHQFSFTDWANSPMASDMNDDGQITEEDYDMIMNTWQMPFGQQPFDGAPPLGFDIMADASFDPAMMRGGWIPGDMPVPGVFPGGDMSADMMGGGMFQPPEGFPFMGGFGFPGGQNMLFTKADAFEIVAQGELPTDQGEPSISQGEFPTGQGMPPTDLGILPTGQGIPPISQGTVPNGQGVIPPKSEAFEVRAGDTDTPPPLNWPSQQTTATITQQNNLTYTSQTTSGFIPQNGFNTVPERSSFFGYNPLSQMSNVFSTQSGLGYIPQNTFAVVPQNGYNPINQRNNLLGVPSGLSYSPQTTFGIGPQRALSFTPLSTIWF